MLKLYSLPVVYLLLSDYPVVQGFIFGLLSLSLFLDIQQYGVKSLILKPSKSIVDQVFTLTEAGDLDGLKQLTRTIPPRDLVEMSAPGRRSILIFAVDSERRDIVRWLV